MENLHEIILKAQHGDRKAFEALYKSYYPKIYRYCMVNIARSDLADDITQETFIRAWKSLPKFKLTKEGTFQAYLYRIARNLLIDLSRKKKEFTLHQYHEIDTGENIEDTLYKEEEIEKVKQALASLNEIDRQIIIFRYFEELSHKECANILGMKEGALRVRTMRVLEKMKITIKEYE